ICTTDHGIAFPRMKCNLTDAGIGVMLIMRGPGGVTGGKGVDALVSHIDLFPTICDVIGIDPPDWLQGVSIVPVVRGDAEDVREEIYAEVNYHAAYEPQRCVRTKRWKYIRRFDDRTKPVLPNCDHGLSKDVWMAHGWPQRKVPSEALYDLIFDPNETHNLAGQEETQEILAGMKARLEGWMRDTDDPLLKGAVQAPFGAEVNDVDGINWSEKTRIVA
ncbi:MAG: sulfatase, partial [Candidatus Latescibacteria bacterium]|nr:sulfatase [Candidatus Latescibacterota bacterium]